MAITNALFDVVVPVFVVAGVGFVYARRKHFPLAGVTDLIVHLTGAALVFDSLVSAPRFDVGSLRAPASAALLILSGIGLATLARALLPPLRKLSLPTVVLPVAFMNAGNLGLPLAGLALGPSGLEVAMLFFVTFSALQYSVGVGFASAGLHGASPGRGDVQGENEARSGGLLEVFRLPLLYAAILGIVVNQLDVELPKAIGVPIHLLGQTVIPLMLLSLGASLARLVGARDDADDADDGGDRNDGAAEKPPLLAVILLPILRIAGGLGAAWLINFALGNEGLFAQVTLLVGAMPPAVMNFALIEKYRKQPAETAAVSAAIAAGTLLSVIVLPVVVATLVGAP